jgi:membrane-associated protease RseP (regulator of RpoE activity)
MLPVPSWTAAASHLERRIVAMSATRPARPLFRAVPAAGLGLALALGACAVSSAAHHRDPAASKTADGGWISLPMEVPPGVVVDTVPMPADPPFTRPSPGFLPHFDVNLIGPHAYHLGERWPVYPQVRSIKQGSAVQRAGLMLGDTVLTVNGRDMREWDVFHDAQVGTVYTLHVRRAGQERDVTFAIEPDATAPGRR